MKVSLKKCKKLGLTPLYMYVPVEWVKLDGTKRPSKWTVKPVKVR